MIYTPEDVFLLSGQRSPKGFVAGLRPAAWFQYGVGITESSGAVSQWDDVSGNGRHLKQATGTNQPALQADGSILFDGTDNYLKCDAFTHNQPVTVYLLSKLITWAVNDNMCSGNGANTGDVFCRTGSPQVGLSGGSAIGNLTLTLDSYCVISFVLNGASSVLQLNNNAPVTGDAGANAAAGFTLGANGGASNFAHMQAKEVINYAAAHDAATRARVIRYLRTIGQI